MIAKKVNMVPEAAERWIVNLILHARLGEYCFPVASAVLFVGQFPLVPLLLHEAMMLVSLLLLQRRASTAKRIVFRWQGPPPVCTSW